MSRRRRRQSGQIILEYILLLFISVTFATLLTKALVSRNKENAGVVTKTWGAMNQAIGDDIIE